MWPKDRSIRSFDGTLIRYTMLGPDDAPVVAFCAGFVCPDIYWKYIAPELESDYRLLIWNYRGIGVSELPRPPGYHAVRITDEELGIESNARDLHVIFEAEGIERAALVGHSMGVQVALDAYRQFPEHVSAIISLAGPYRTPLRTFYGTDLSSRLMPVALPLLHALPRLSLLGWRALVHNPLSYHAGKLVRAIGAKAKAEDMAGYFDHVSMIDPLIAAKMIRGMHSHSAEDLLEKIDVPVLIVHGTSDPFTPLIVAKEMAERIPTANLVVIQDGSHTLPIESPDEILAAVRPFLKRAFSVPC